MIHRSLLVLCLLALAACGPDMKSWQGQPATSLIMNWGAPAAVVSTDDGTQYLTYVNYNAYNHWCRRTFKVIGGRIVDWRAVGECTLM